MKKLFIVSLLLLPCTKLQAQKVFVADYESKAQVKVWVAAYESQADLKVYKVSYESQARGNAGRWFFAQYEGQADKKIVFTSESSANLKIFYVEYENQAGWINPSKEGLMEKDGW